MHRSLALAIESFETGLAASRRPEDRVLVERYLAALAKLLAQATLGNDVLRRLDDFERLLGHTHLVDPGPFAEALAHWKAFRDEYENFVLGSMTVSERLAALALYDAYGQALRRRDLGAMTTILRRARVDEASIQGILKQDLL